MSPSMSLVRSKQAAALLAVPFLMLFGCKDANQESSTAAAAKEAPGTVHPEIWPSPKWPFEKDAALEEKVAALLAKMTVEKRSARSCRATSRASRPRT